MDDQHLTFASLAIIAKNRLDYKNYKPYTHTHTIQTTYWKTKLAKINELYSFQAPEFGPKKS